ncbi:MAG TPA: PAS domain S-box protein [Gemmatimonadaceae bacterium]|nr:PAS domain S-box protein [Gemmatimonadaceae bacterium]
MGRGSEEVTALRARIDELETRLTGVDKLRQAAESSCTTLRNVLEAVSDAFVALDADWRYTYVNARAGLIFGRDPASLIGRHIWTEFPDGVGQPFQLAYERALAEGRPRTIEAYYPPFDRWFENRIYPYAGGLAIFFRDVTEQRRAKAQLQEAETSMRAIVEQSLMGVYLIENGRFTYVSPRFAEMVGYSARELYELPSAFSIIHPDDRPRAERHLHGGVSDRDSSPVHVRLLRKDGSVSDLEAQCRIVEFARGLAMMGFQIDITDRVRAEAELRASEARFRALIEHASDAILILDADAIIRYASPSTERIFGGRADARVGRSAVESVHPEDSARILDEFHALRATPGRMVTAEYRVRHVDGAWRHVGTIAQNFLDDPAVRGIIVNTRDITGRIESEAALRASEARYRAVFASAGIGVARISLRGRWLEVNRRACEITGYSAEELVGRPWSDILDPTDRAHDTTLLRGLLSGKVPSLTVDRRFVRKDGDVVWVKLTYTVVREPNRVPRSLAVILEDVTERRTLEARLRELAFHDPLTGLANRALFHDRVTHAFERAEREAMSAAVLFLDIDDFKRVNDSLGHAAGDELLLAAAERIRTTVRSSDTAARFGGDEFAVLVEDTHSPADAAELAERLTAAFFAPFSVAGREIVTGASIGVAIAEPGETPDEVLRNADVAMYVAKARGRGKFQMFAPGMHAAVLARVELEADLRRALSDTRATLDHDGFRLVFQPIVELATRRTVGAEALLRWHDGERGDVSPATFIPIAEETGLILPLGRWVLREACRAGATWAAQHAAHHPEQSTRPNDVGLAITVNVSGRQLVDPGFVDDVRLALAESGLPPERLVLELTESVLIHHAPEIAERLQALRTLGTRLAVDDFGTGYSSLIYLQRFPLDILKMDRLFVRALGWDGSDAAIARAVVALGHALELQTVAEGVESAREAEQLQRMGCSAAQGYHFAMPISADDVERFVARTGEGPALGSTRVPPPDGRPT